MSLLVSRLLSSVPFDVEASKLVWTSCVCRSLRLNDVGVTLEQVCWSLVLTLLCSDVQKKNAAASAADYKKTDEAQPDVKEGEEEAEEAEPTSPGGYQVRGGTSGLLGLTRVFISDADEKNEEEESPAEKEEDKEGAADEVRRRGADPQQSTAVRSRSSSCSPAPGLLRLMKVPG